MGSIRTLLLAAGLAVAAGALSVAAEAPQPAAGVDEAHMTRADDHPGEWAGPGGDGQAGGQQQGADATH